MSSRERILERLKKAERRPGLPEPKLPVDGAIFKDYPDDPQSLVGLFESRLGALKGELYRVRDKRAAASRVLALVEGAGGGRCLAHSDPLIEEVVSSRPELSRIVDRDASEPLDSPSFAAYAAGISTADFLVARTGSVVLRSSRAGGRRLTVLPPLHIVLARSAHLVLSLEDTLEDLHADGSWSYAAIVSGPSRTADIEKVLVLGAHGPKKLAVVLLDE